MIVCLVSVGNRISDVGLENLCKVLDTLPNLSVLDLACNDVTPVGLNHLCSIVTAAENRALQVSVQQTSGRARSAVSSESDCKPRG